MTFNPQPADLTKGHLMSTWLPEVPLGGQEP